MARPLHVGRPVAYGDGTGARYRPRRRTVGLDSFGLSPTTTLGNMKLGISDTWYEHTSEHTDLAIRGNLSLNVGVGVIRGLDGEELGSFTFCPHCGILKLSRGKSGEQGAGSGEARRVES